MTDPNLAPTLEAVQSAPPEGDPSNGTASKGANALIIQYDAFNRIGHVDRSFDGGATFQSVADYTYFADGRRATKKANVYDPNTAQLVRQDNLAFISDGAREIEEVDLGSGQVVANYIWGASDIDELRVFQNSNGRFSVFGDRQMTSLLVCDFNTAIPVERYSYTNEYGRCQVMSPGTLDTTGGGNNVLGSAVSLAQEVRCPFRFQGRRYDDETGLYYFRARYMDPEEGRFVTRDPMGIWWDEDERGNGYTFEGGNPTSSRDPFGLDDTPAAKPDSNTAVAESGHRMVIQNTRPETKLGYTGIAAGMALPDPGGQTVSENVTLDSAWVQGADGSWTQTTDTIIQLANGTGGNASITNGTETWTPQPNPAGGVGFTDTHAIQPTAYTAVISGVVVAHQEYACGGDKFVFYIYYTITVTTTGYTVTVEKTTQSPADKYNAKKPEPKPEAGTVPGTSAAVSTPNTTTGKADADTNATGRASKWRHYMESQDPGHHSVPQNRWPKDWMTHDPPEK